ncbi:lipocalin family protein [Viridibacterium curvum]|uniref:Outer membrane lipoprotein Blc n=1 Tax=Viridibacterium curvum TaxID=1101404 RepID=A0ABP9QUM2_9RHOO
MTLHTHITATRRRLAAALFCSLALSGLPAAHAAEPPATVTTLDLNRYLGTWYEIASYPQRFQRDCVATRADYSLRPDSKLRVLNRCRKETLDGTWKEAEGRARVVAPGKLKVSFFWPFEGDYWVIALDPDYRWALVGGPGRDYLWILSRSPQMDDATYAAITAKAVEQGFALEPLRRTLQGAD